ncbi:hypothetical protein DXV75_09445 [Alteromonas aestuariivivens]|uniref:DUF3630 family protein n=1 Tax=Alteromonas aestuariivivens TaxID=1938339 RepID=A0A3D8M6U2_9ALTE|nr:hypothetical protein [Alteromonas aestuariivivens]RDV25512.1 hypothetical protein DXV75_09445 [Alteromonas aestuariivivens]
MQQLDVHVLYDTLILDQDIIRLHQPLPVTPAATEYWVKQFCLLVGFEPLNAEWGADRFQATLFNGQFYCLLCIEWLCDSIWLESSGGSDWDAAALWRCLRDKCKSQGAG